MTRPREKEVFDAIPCASTIAAVAAALVFVFVVALVVAVH